MDNKHENERNQFWTDINITGTVTLPTGEVKEHTYTTGVRISIIRPQDITGQWNATAKLMDESFKDLPSVTVKFDPNTISNLEAANAALKQIAAIMVSIAPDYTIDEDDIV